MSIDNNQPLQEHQTSALESVVNQESSELKQATHLLPKKSPPYAIIIGVIIILLAFIFIFLLFFSSKTATLFSGKTNKLTPTIPNQIQSPTPTPQLSEIASASAYLNLKATVAELTTTLNNYPLNDQSLNPPIIEIPLGFSQ